MVDSKKHFRTGREFVARWMMRVRQASAQLKIAFFGLTALSTTVTALKGTPYSQYSTHLAAIFLVGTVVFTWAYDVFHVMNIQNRWGADRSSNFLSPESAINHVVRSRQLAVLGAALSDGSDDAEDLAEVLENVTFDALDSYGDGIDMEEIRG